MFVLPIRLLTLSPTLGRKCSSFVPGKKTAQGDKPAVRKDHLPVRLDYTRLPYAVRSLETVNEQVEQRRIVSASKNFLGFPLIATKDWLVIVLELDFKRWDPRPPYRR